MPSYTISTPHFDYYAGAITQFEQLLETLSGEQAQRATHGEIEALIQQDGMKLLCQMIQGHLDQRAQEEPRQTSVVGADGYPRTHHRAGCTRLLETRFGEVKVTRRGYGAPGLESVFPLDAALNLPPDKYSHGLCEVVADAVVDGSFDAACAHLKQVGGGQMAKRQAEDVAVHLSQDFDAFYAQPLLAQPPSESCERFLIISADGKGIVMHPRDLREATRKARERQAHKQQTRLSPGEKKQRKRMATVASVYEVDPYPRTPEQILDPKQAPEGKRPRVQNKRTWARVEADQRTVIEQAFAEAMRRDPDQQRRWVVLCDGQEDLLRQVTAAAERYKVEVVVIQDFVHVLEYLWKAAHALFPETPTEREQWVMERAMAILEGRAHDVAVGLRRAATRKQLGEAARKPVDKAADYLDNNRARLRYDQALAQGMPIATGVIEGACRHLVKDRMDLTGARWGLARAEAILKLRSLKISGDLPAYLAFHFDTERQRHYPGPPIPLNMPVAA
jgi:hypothetical protein